MHVSHCHSPSIDNQKETTTHEQIIKKLTDPRRVTIFKALWKQVETNNPWGAAEPTAIFGGDYNCTDLQWSHCLRKASETQGSRRKIQRCVSSHSAPSYKVHKGDRAIVFNGYALQQDSHWGKRTGAKRGANKPPYFSDDHDLVIVPIHWRLNKVWDMNAGRWKNSTKSGTWRRSFAPADSGAQPAPSPVAPSHPKPTHIVSNTHSSSSSELSLIHI